MSFTSNKSKSAGFYHALENILETRNRKLPDLCEQNDLTAKRILEEYGAIFLAHKSVTAPPVCMFSDADSVDRFQAGIGILAADFNLVTIELQRAAMNALLAARQTAQNNDLDVTPRGGAEAARRSFDDTLRLWNSRVFPALAYWIERGQISVETAEQLKAMPLKKQISAILKLEEQNIFFSKDFSKSILYSVAAPGCSQHLSLLAFDASEFQNQDVRQILAAHGWFRTVQNDLPHFTFLGRNENELPALGLKKLETADGEFWIPNV